MQPALAIIRTGLQFTKQSQFDTSNVANCSAPFAFVLLRSGNNIYLEFTAIPESGSILAICAGALGLGAWIRRRLRQEASSSDPLALAGRN